MIEFQGNFRSMPTYLVHAVNIGSFPLGESDKVLTLFSAERGVVRAVAKGARKPGTKLSGKADVLSVNKLLVATGRSLDIITQAESIESYPKLRHDLTRLSFGLYYAELTHHFGQGLSDESVDYFDYLCASLALQSDPAHDPILLGLTFEIGLLNMLGYKPELDYCVVCRNVLTEYNLAVFHYERGGIICDGCFSGNKRHQNIVREKKEIQGRYFGEMEELAGSPAYAYDFKRTHITPMIWKSLVLAGNGSLNSFSISNSGAPGAAGQRQITNKQRAAYRGHRIVQSYIEHKAGKRMKSLDLVTQVISTGFNDK